MLSLTKTYGDLELLFVSDIHGMWTELETKVNGNIDSSDVNSGWASWSQVTLDHDLSWYFGSTASAFVKFDSDLDLFIFAHVTTARNTIFKLGGTEVARIDTSANFIVKKDIFFVNRNTTYGLSYLLGYAKPIIQYVDGTTIKVEQNVATANKTLIVFPAGPIAVTEDVAATHKFRELKTSATANGYISTHTGAADSGLRVGLSLVANTWYFVYAVVCRYGDDAGNNFILVVDDTSPKTSNWSTLDTRYGAGYWVYLGAYRYGHGGAQTTTMIPFQYDHQGWLTFLGRAAAGNFFGVRVASSSISSSTLATMASFSALNVGDGAPDTMSLMKITARVVADADVDMEGRMEVTNSSDETMFYLPAFGNNLTGTEAHGWEFKIPNSQGIKLKGKRGGSATEDFDYTVYISAVLDEWV